jgi:hypothetical protein
VGKYGFLGHRVLTANYRNKKTVKILNVNNTRGPAYYSGELLFANNIHLYVESQEKYALIAQFKQNLKYYT